MPVNFCSDENTLKKSLPKDLVCVDITSITDRTDLSGKYVQAEIDTKYNLHTYQISSMKIVLKGSNGKCINLHAFGPIAADLDVCAVGDTLVLLQFDVDSCPKNRIANGFYQIILDDQKPIKPVVWVLRGRRKGNTIGSPSPGVQAVTRKKSATPAASPIDVNQNQKKSPSYTYTLLKDVQIRTTVHVYGVVSYTRSPVKSSGADYYMMVNIVDPSLLTVQEKLTCSLFHAEEGRLPTQAKAGDIIRFHRLKIQTYQGKKQATGGPGFHWVLFQGCFDEQVASSKSYTLEAVDKDKVSNLLKWWEEISCLFNQGTDLAMVSSEVTSARSPSSPAPSTSGLSSSSSSPAGASFLKKLTPIKQPPVVYQTLMETKEHTVVSFYAVVVYARPAVFTRRSEYHLMMNVTDQSLGDRDAKLTCNLFYADKDMLPHQAFRGDVIRFHHIKIQTYNGKKQAVKKNALQWVLFQQSFDKRISSSPNCVVKDEEKNKVQSLFDWWLEGPDSTPFSKVVNKQYFYLVCQIIAVCLMEEKQCRLLKVWDGTKFNGPIVSLDVAGIEQDKTLTEAAGDLAHDVFIFDDHITSTDNLKPGDFIQLTNLHAAVVQGQVEMTLHGGTAYQRGAKKLNVTDRAVVKLKTVLDPIVSKACGLDPKKDDEDKGAASTSKDKNSLSSSVNKNASLSTSKAKNNLSLSRRKGNKHDDIATTTKHSPQKSNNPSSISRKRLFVEPSDDAPKTKRPSLSKDSEDTKGSSQAHDTNDNSSVNVIIISDSCATTSSSSGPSMRDSNSSNASHLNSLSISSLPSPPSSLNLSERDRFMVEAILEKEKRKEMENESRRENVCESEKSRDMRNSGHQLVENTQDTNSAIAFSTCDSSRDVIFYDSQTCSKCLSSEKNSCEKDKCLSHHSSHGEGQPRTRSQRLLDKSEGICDQEHLQNSSSGKGSNSSGKQKENDKTKNPESSRTTDCSKVVPSTSQGNKSDTDLLNDLLLAIRKSTENNEPIISSRDEVVSSQESFHTAITSVSSPRLVNIPDRTTQVLALESPKKYLSLRSQMDATGKRVSQTGGENEDVVSSSVDSGGGYSVPRDRQQTDQSEEISSSTDSKDSNKAGGALAASTEDNEWIATVVSPLNQNRKCCRLETFVTKGKNTKCKVRVRLEDYFPRTGNAADLVQYCCFNCKYMIAYLDLRRKRNPRCPNGCGLLNPHIIVKLLLSDGEYQITTLLWRHNAIEFFGNVTPKQLLMNAPAQMRVQQCFDTLCPPQTKLKDKPLMECCVFAYMVNNEMHFQMFDTIAVV